MYESVHVPWQKKNWLHIAMYSLTRICFDINIELDVNVNDLMYKNILRHVKSIILTFCHIWTGIKHPNSRTHFYAPKETMI